MLAESIVRAETILLTVPQRSNALGQRQMNLWFQKLKLKLPKAGELLGYADSPPDSKIPRVNWNRKSRISILDDYK